MTGNKVLKSYLCPASTEKSNAFPFGDVNEGAYYTKALRWAASRGFIAGVRKNELAPNAPITREQMATILIRYLIEYDIFGHTDDYDENFAFSDIENVSEYAKLSVEMSGKAGIMAGDENGRFNPRAYTKRCEAAVVFCGLDSIVSELLSAG